jgi:hypothetical protein
MSDEPGWVIEKRFLAALGEKPLNLRNHETHEFAE